MLKLNRNKLCESGSDKEDANNLKPLPVEKNRMPSGFFFKYYFRRMFLFYFNMRYLNVFSLSNQREIYKYSFERHVLPKTLLSFEDSKFEELFEMADKAIFLGISMLEIDIAELNSVDNFKENYIFTVKNLFSIFKLNRALMRELKGSWI